MALTFTSCQDEFEKLPEDEAQEQAINASSSTAKLIEDTCSNDGSFDNIVDESSCFNINFPYTVNVNGVELTINSIENLDMIEEIFDALEDDEDVLDIIFPITITMADYAEVTINGIEDLRELAQDCKEGGDDDDIECIDFVYPITMYTFDLNNEETGNIIVESDKDLRRFFAGLDKDDLISMDFPVTLKLYDDTEMVVNSNAEMAAAIENAKELCDEDDDNDHNDDDFTQERLEEYLVECPWLIHEVKRDNQLQTDQYIDYVMNFTEDGAVKVVDREGNELNGTWSTRVAEHKVMLKMEFDDLVDFTLEWFVYELGEGRIKIYGDDGNRIIMHRGCDIINDDPNTLREVLTECSWIIKRVFNEGQEIKRLLGFEFNFEPEGVVTLSSGDIVSQGTWEITTNEQGRLVMAITMGEEPGVSFEWPLSDLRDDRLKFSIPGTDYELVLERNCDNDDNDEDVTWIRGLFNETEWELALFNQNEDPMVEAYGGFIYKFSTDGAITVLDQDMQEISTGKWYVYRNSDEKLEMIIRFEPGSNFQPLSNDYKILEVEENRIELKHENRYGGYDHLIFEKI
ncbi:hypothetical protein FB2170_02315 [Maribacter sp. HTCC2170]|nr:hypothetical protein FB2170_02315 [Maribacter sp. HTCC2170]